jgi:MoaA/NifB/PqqE/SkfB family radical SAM enzyme
MSERIKAYWELYNQFRKPDGKRFAVIEGNQGCNRACSYCDVPRHYNAERELTLKETCGTVDWLHSQGYRVLSYLGGEPLAPFKTKEGISFAQHTIEVVRYAKKKSMLVNITTNGDYVSPNRPEIVEELRNAGLDSMTFSLHSYTEASVRHLTDGARLAAQNRIVPAIQAVMTSETADKLPGIAARAARNGILFSVGLVQTQGDGFAREQDMDVIPSKEQQERIFAALSVLKRYGFVRNSRSYLEKGTDYFPNNWTCDAEKDTFIKIGAGGKVNVCSRVETGLHVEDIITLDDAAWRERKKVGVSNCGNCLYHCYYEAQNPDILGDIPTIAVGLAIKSGGASFVERWGNTAVTQSMRRVQNVDWSVRL